MKGADSESAWLAWLILFILVNAYWIGYDVWAGRTHHFSMTHEMRNWLTGQLSGPLCAGILAFVVFAFLYHMFQGRIQP